MIRRRRMVRDHADRFGPDDGRASDYQACPGTERSSITRHRTSAPRRGLPNPPLTNQGRGSAAPTPPRPRPPRFAGGTPHCGRRFAPSSRTPPLRAPRTTRAGMNEGVGARDPTRQASLSSSLAQRLRRWRRRRPARGRLPEAPAAASRRGRPPKPVNLAAVPHRSGSPTRGRDSSHCADARGRRPAGCTSDSACSSTDRRDDPMGEEDAGGRVAQGRPA